MLKNGYSDGSGKGIITLDDKAIIKVNWGCGCCEYEDEKSKKRAKELLKLLKGKETELRKIWRIN